MEMTKKLIQLVVAFLIAGLPVGMAQAAKWHSCPEPPVPPHPSRLGATAAPFIHPGHPLTIMLNEDEVQATGGFRTKEPNRVRIRMVSLFGETVALTRREVRAESPNVLTVAFPDAEQELGRPLAGPVEVAVRADGQWLAFIDHRDLVAVPRSTDVTDLVLGREDSTIVYGAIDARGDLWVPASFHGKHMAMPGCEGDFIHPVPIELGMGIAEALGEKLRQPFENIRGAEGYLGDMWIGGYNYYGYLFAESIRLINAQGTLGISICEINDAIEVVLRVRGDQSLALEKSSPFQNVCERSAPLALRVSAAPMIPGMESASLSSEQIHPLLRDGLTRDSFSHECRISLGKLLED